MPIISNNTVSDQLQFISGTPGSIRQLIRKQDSGRRPELKGQVVIRYNKLQDKAEPVRSGISIPTIFGSSDIRHYLVDTNPNITVEYLYRYLATDLPEIKLAIKYRIQAIAGKETLLGSLLAKRDMIESEFDKSIRNWTIEAFKGLEQLVFENTEEFKKSLVKNLQS